MINIYGNTRIKDYESLQENQNVKNSILQDNDKINRIKLIISLLCGLFIIMFLSLYLRHYFNSKNENQLKRELKIDNQLIQQNETDNFNILNNKTQVFLGIQPNQQQNELNELIPPNNYLYKVYEITKPSNLNISYYSDYLPKNNMDGKSTFTDLKNIFTSKVLYINDKNLTNEYIKFVRQSDGDEDKYKKMLYQGLSFDNNPILPREGQLSTKDFFNLCDRNYIDFQTQIEYLQDPIISIIIPMYNKNINLVRTLRSIQNQSFKNIEIIIVDDISTSNTEFYKSLFESETRLRLFTQLKNMGLWRKRLDGFLYSRGKYILHFGPGDIFADNYVLEDMYNLVSTYSLDTVRFSFSRTKYDKDFMETKKFNEMKLYPANHIRIIYGRPDYNIHAFGYGTIWNRLVRATIFTKGLDLVDEYILNANKNLWEDMWWNDLIDRVSFSNLIINRLGYILLYDRNTAIEPFIKNQLEKEKTIREFIYFWYFDYQLLPKDSNKKNIISTLKNYNMKNNRFCGIPMRLDFLISRFEIFERLLTLLINDPFVDNLDKEFIRILYNNEINKEKNILNNEPAHKTMNQTKSITKKTKNQITTKNINDIKKQNLKETKNILINTNNKVIDKNNSKVEVKNKITNVNKMNKETDSKKQIKDETKDPKKYEEKNRLNESQNKRDLKTKKNLSIEKTKIKSENKSKNDKDGEKSQNKDESKNKSSNKDKTKK